MSDKSNITFPHFWSEYNFSELRQRLNNAVLGRILLRWVPNVMLSRQVQMAVDGGIAALSFFIAHLVRFDGWPPNNEVRRMVFLLPYLVACRLAVGNYTGLYRLVWRYISISDALRLANVVAIISAILLTFRIILADSEQILTVPLSIIFMDFVLTTCGMICARLLWRVTCENAARAKVTQQTKRQRVLLVGAGEAGIATAREITRRPDLGMKVCGFVDDDAKKTNTIIQGLKVLGTTEKLPHLVRSLEIDQVVIAIATAKRRTLRHVVELCEAAQVPIKIIPGLHEIISNNVTISNVRPVEIEDLLGRDTIDVEAWLNSSRNSFSRKRVLVTGGGGSIGRELCRQLVALDPVSIILLDKDENSVFEAERELRQLLTDQNITGINLVPVICDLRIVNRLRGVFQKHRPEVVFHAAAHKHVPLMESNAAEAVLNNVVGAQRLLEVCADFNVPRCVLVSTDKAVNPTNIMGATKRVAELLFQRQALTLNGSSKYSCVRFGNVLGSRGSVVPIFREQIKQGGPITITHPEVERYFMTIPEAAQLIIQAGALGQRGEIFVLDMGEPVKMVDMARDMIRLSGLMLGEDIEIEFTGLRPGEKMKEELLIAEEGTRMTKHEKIFVAAPLQYDFARLDDFVGQLVIAAEMGDDEEIYALFAAMQIGFHPQRYTKSGKLAPPSEMELEFAESLCR